MSPLAKILSPRKRLTREESKALTRRRLIDVGRKHILRDGLGNAVAERIAEEAGYSRGAFYGNFEDKEDLFLAILLQDQEQQYSLFRAIFDRNSNPKVLVKEMRDAFATRVTNGEWVFLQAEFEAGALRSEKMKALYAEMHRHMLREGLEIARRLAKAPKVRMLLKPADLMITMISLSQGLAVNQRLLGNDLSESNTRKLIREIFDQFISVDD